MLGVRALQRNAAMLAARAPMTRPLRQSRGYSAGSAPRGGQIMEATEETFEKDVIDSPVPTVVDFYASWCGPCKMLGPIIEKAVQADGRVNLVKVDVDSNLSLSSDFKVTSLPTVMGFRDGQPVAAFIGMRPPAAVTQFVKDIAEGTEK
ncbi:hypothetical protein GGF46_004827 [Coemansia sp. RSA 552]|nr:hypothetical protein GGF46_004827 [Coemansia sp. RSA 552]